MEGTPPLQNKGINKENTGRRKPGAAREMQETRIHQERNAEGTSRLCPQGYRAWTTPPKAHSPSAGRAGDGKRMFKCQDGGSSSVLSSFCGKQVMPKLMTILHLEKKETPQTNPIG